MILERNPDYAWAPGWPSVRGPSNIARVVHRFIPNNATRVAALGAGEVHMADILPALDTRRLGDSGRFRAMIGVAAGLSFGAQLNASRATFDDIRVRQAFMHAIDRRRLAQDLCFGLVQAASGPLASGTPTCRSGVEQYFTSDRARAARLLHEAGRRVGPNNVRVKEGTPLRVFFPSPLLPDVAVALQSEARRVGFDIVVENALKQRQDELPMNDQHEMAVVRWAANDAGVRRIPFRSSNIPESGKLKFNLSRVSDPALDGLIERAAAARSPAMRFLRRLFLHPGALAGTIVFAMLVVAAIVAPLVAPHDWNATDVGMRLAVPGAEHPFGTDLRGRDIFARVIAEGRYSIPLGIATVLLCVLVGSVIGVALAFVGGRVDGCGCRLRDVLLGFPAIVLAVMIVSVRGVGLVDVVIAGVPRCARVVRGAALLVREQLRVEAARALGASDLRIMLRHLLPNVMPTIVVLATLDLGNAILSSAALSFLGLGAQPPTPGWGAMLSGRGA